MRSSRHLLSISIFMSVFMLLASSLTAQVPVHVPKGDAFLGYSRLNSDTFYPNVGGLNGWQAALNVKVKTFVGLEADVSQYGLGAVTTIPKTFTVLAGPRITVGAMGVRVFVHALAGGEHSANSSGLSISGGSLTVAAGGGVDLPIFPFFSWRVMGDYLTAPTLSPGTGSHSRIGTGLVFRF